jgi:hypothetical protein
MKYLGILLLLVAAMSTEAPMSASNDTYHFGPATFKTEFWINNKAVFKKPKNVNVEFVTAGAFDWVIADSSGHEVKTVRHKNEHGGWTGIDFASLGLYQDYSIGFRNASGNEQEIKQGDVEMR